MSFLLLFMWIFAIPVQADIYPTDQFNINKICVSNPWNGTNYKGDVSPFPCHYDYAIIHVPTYETEIQTRISTAVALALAQQQQTSSSSQQSSVICPSIWSFSGSYEDARQLANVILGLFAIVFIVISVKRFLL